VAQLPQHHFETKSCGTFSLHGHRQDERLVVFQVDGFIAAWGMTDAHGHGVGARFVTGNDLDLGSSSHARNADIRRKGQTAPCRQGEFEHKPALDRRRTTLVPALSEVDRYDVPLATI